MKYKLIKYRKNVRIIRIINTDIYLWLVSAQYFVSLSTDTTYTMNHFV